MNKIKSDGIVFALVFRFNDSLKEGHNFLTSNEENLQAGIINQKKGHLIDDHFHHPIERNIYGTQEMMYIEKGRVKIRFLTEIGEIIEEHILEHGDLAILLRGGHGFVFLEDSKVIYVKQGPYSGREKDKENFRK